MPSVVYQAENCTIYYAYAGITYNGSRPINFELPDHTAITAAYWSFSLSKNWYNWPSPTGLVWERDEWGPSEDPQHVGWFSDRGAGRFDLYSLPTTQTGTAIASFGIYVSQDMIQAERFGEVTFTDITFTLEYVYTHTPCTAPTVTNLSDGVAETAATLRWSGAAGGIENTVTGYRIQYRDSADGETWTPWTDYATVAEDANTPGAGSLSVSPYSARGGYRRFRIRAEGAAGADFYSEYLETDVLRTNTIPGAPTGLSALPTVYESGQITLGWTAPVDALGAVDRCELQYRTRPAGGSFGSWTALANVQALTYAHAPALNRGSVIQYRIRAVDVFGMASDWAAFPDVTRNQLPGAPVNPAVTPALFEAEDLTVTWTAPAVTTSAVDHYELFTALSDDGSTWSTPVPLTQTSAINAAIASASLSVGRGQYLRILLRTVDSLGAMSDFSSCQTRKNSAPGAPASLTLSAGQTVNGLFIFESLPITLTWTASTDTDRNLDHYEWAAITGGADIANREPAAGDVQGTTAGLTASYNTAVARGTYLRLAVRAVDAKGAMSPWRYALLARRNQLPTTPTLLYPAAGGLTTLSGDPVFGGILPGSTDGSGVELQARIRTTSATVQDWQTVMPDAYGHGFRLGLSLTAGAYIVEIRSVNALGACSDSVSAAFTVDAQAWIRPIAAGTVIARDGVSVRRGVLNDPGGSVTGTVLDVSNGTVTGTVLEVTGDGISHQMDLLELLAAVNTRRAWFGLAAVAFSSEVGYFANWMPQMRELAAALNACTGLAGEPDLVISQPGSNYPTAATINAVRQCCERL